MEIKEKMTVDKKEKKEFFNWATLGTLALGLILGSLITIIFIPAGQKKGNVDKKEVQREMIENWYKGDENKLYSLGYFSTYTELRDIDVDKRESQNFEKKVMDFLLRDIAEEQVGVGLKSVNWDTKISPSGKVNRKAGEKYLDIESTLQMNDKKDGYLVQISDYTFGNRDYKVMKVPVKIAIGWYTDEEKKEEDVSSITSEYKIVVDFLKELNFSGNDKRTPYHFLVKLASNIDKKKTGYIERDVQYDKSNANIIIPRNGDIAGSRDDFFGQLGDLMNPSNSELMQKINEFNGMNDNPFDATFSLDPVDNSVYFVETRNNKTTVKVEAIFYLRMGYKDEDMRKKVQGKDLEGFSNVFGVNFTEK